MALVSIVPSAPAPTKARASIPYGELRHCHAEYDRDLFVKLEDLYEAGWALLAKAREYLPQPDAEINANYEHRCKTATCLPYFAQIVDQFSSDLFSQPLTVTPAGDAKNPNTIGEFPDEDYYSEFAKDADGGGNGFVDILADVLTTALKLRRGYLFVDAPDTGNDEQPANRAQEDESGANRCYVYELPPLQLIDWKCDKKGEFVWAVTCARDEEQEEPAVARTTIREIYTIWRRADSEDGGATWARYVAEWDPVKQPKGPEEKQPIDLDDDGETSFPCIPILKLELTKGLWVGNKVGTQQLEHWRRRSELIGSESRSCHAIPTTFLGGEMSPANSTTLPSEVQQNPHRGANPMAEFRRRGVVRLGSEDDFRFVEPEGKAYALIDKELDGLKDEMFRVVHMMAASVKNTPGSLGRSGLSKAKDGESTVKVLSALGRKVRGLALKAYDTLSGARGEDVVWVAHGLDSYEVDDREQVLEESLELQMVNIPSPTFKKEHAKRLVGKLVPNLPPATVAQINEEIDEGIEQLDEIDQIEKEAHKQEVLNPEPPQVPGAPAPKAPAAPKPPKPGGPPDKK